MLLHIILYACAGLAQEVMIVAYHDAIARDKKLLVAFLTVMISLVNILVVTQVIHQILINTGVVSIIGAATFAISKGVGAYLTLGYLQKNKNLSTRP